MTVNPTQLAESSADGEAYASATALCVTFGLLLLLLAATVAADLLLSGIAGTITGLSIAVLKTALIVAVFMNLRWSTPLIRLASVAAVLWLSFALMFVMGDYITRGWNESDDQSLQPWDSVSRVDATGYPPADAVSFAR